MPKFQPEGHVVLLLHHIGEETEETNEKQQRCIRGDIVRDSTKDTLKGGVPHQSRDGPKGARACGGSVSGKGIFPLSPTPTGLWPVDNPPAQKKTSRDHRGGVAAKGNPAHGPDVSCHLLPYQRNWD